MLLKKIVPLKLAETMEFVHFRVLHIGLMVPALSKMQMMLAFVLIHVLHLIYLRWMTSDTNLYYLDVNIAFVINLEVI